MKNWQGLQTERSQFEPIAPFAGRFYWADPDLAVGQWVGKKETLGHLVQETGAWRVETWLDEDEISRVRVGQTAHWMTDAGAGAMLALKVVAIDSDAARQLPRKELASPLGGHIMAREKNGQWVPERAIYRVSLEAQELPAQLRQQQWRGQLVIEADWTSPLARYVRQALTVLIREASF